MARDYRPFPWARVAGIVRHYVIEHPCQNPERRKHSDKHDSVESRHVCASPNSGPLALAVVG